MGLFQQPASHRFFVFWLGLILWSLSTGELAQAELPIGWSSARALGMGNAYTAIVADSDAIFYNPAAMVQINGIHWEIIDPHMGIGNPQNAQLASKISNISNIPATINSLYGKEIWAGGGAKSAVTTPYFAVAAYANSENGVYAAAPPNPRLNLNYYFDYGGAVSMAADFIPGFFSVGTTVRYINRTGTTNPIGLSNLANLNSQALQAQLQSRGTGYNVDVGALFRVPGPVSPSASFVYRSIGQTLFTQDQGPTAPPPIPSEMVFGLGLTAKLLLMTITPAIDIRYLGWSGVTTGMNVGAGIEIALPLLDLRAGLSQGYYTAGVGIDFGPLRADAATWAVELGTYPGQQPDRRYMAELTIEFGFDPIKFWSGASSGGKSGGGGGSGGSGGLKQRR